MWKKNDINGDRNSPVQHRCSLANQTDQVLNGPCSARLEGGKTKTETTLQFECPRLKPKGFSTNWLNYRELWRLMLARSPRIQITTSRRDCVSQRRVCKNKPRLKQESCAPVRMGALPRHYTLFLLPICSVRLNILRKQRVLKRKENWVKKQRERERAAAVTTRRVWVSQIKLHLLSLSCGFAWRSERTSVVRFAWIMSFSLNFITTFSQKWSSELVFLLLLITYEGFEMVGKRTKHENTRLVATWRSERSNNDYKWHLYNMLSRNPYRIGK